VKQFSSLLKEHQKAILSDGFTVLESAVIQHNLRSVSNMYENIAINQLAVLLGLSEDTVESLACDMIFQGRLQGYINQVCCLSWKPFCLQQLLH
jgi:COP9 signalosome complex subunit 4